MTEHGIWTTKAFYWVHFFPLERQVYWYVVANCRTHILAHQIPVKIGRSKDGTPTSEGYLIDRSLPWIESEAVPSEYMGDADWSRMTDRQAGIIGQERVFQMIGEIIVPSDMMWMSQLRKRRATIVEEMEGWDVRSRWIIDVRFECKTERVKSGNIFVQKAEAGHRVHQILNDDGSISERLSSINDGSENI